LFCSFLFFLKRLPMKPTAAGRAMSVKDWVKGLELPANGLAGRDERWKGSLLQILLYAPRPLLPVSTMYARFLPHLCRADRVWYSYRELDITTAADLLLDEPNDSLEGRKAQVFLALQIASQKKFNEDVKDVYPFFVQGVEDLRKPPPPAPASAAAPAPIESLANRLDCLITLDVLADAGFEKSQTAGREALRERMLAGLAKLYALAPPPLPPPFCANCVSYRWQFIVAIGSL
jgi:hypothetical protein